MRISERSSGTTTILELHGTLYAPEATEQLGTTIQRLTLAGRSQIVIHLGDVPAIDAAGLGALVDAHCAASRSGGSLTLARVARRLHALMAVTGLVAVFAIADTLEDAVRSRADLTMAPSMPTVRMHHLPGTSQRSLHGALRHA